MRNLGPAYVGRTLYMDPDNAKCLIDKFHPTTLKRGFSMPGLSLVALELGILSEKVEKCKIAMCITLSYRVP